MPRKNMAGRGGRKGNFGRTNFSQLFKKLPVVASIQRQNKRSSRRGLCSEPQKREQKKYLRRRIHRTAPRQLLPQPAVHARQWIPV